MNAETFTPERILSSLIGYVIVIVSLTFHEWGHAFTADKLGDDTPRRMGRVTLNPLAHIDPIGTVLLPLLGIFLNFPLIGWAKPVLINPDNLPKNSQRSWVTIAGPAMNLILALIGAVVLGYMLHIQQPQAANYAFLFMLINVNLMVFNLLPVPPLDGSKFLMYWFRMSESAYASFARYGWLVLMVLINIPFTQGWLWKLMGIALEPFIAIAKFIR